MPRANRHFIPGYIWHLTHRCHKREFLLKFARDRSRWVELLYEARKRFNISILNYTVTSNHIHLLVSDNGFREAIPSSMQLVAGRAAQEYNRRKSRTGAFWEDRYHATAIETGEHLWRCMVYVDLNMVRAGVVQHPSEWRWSGYGEIQEPKQRYRIVDHGLLRQLLHVESNKDIAEIHRRWIESELKKSLKRQACYSTAVAVGEKAFVKTVQERLGFRGTGRKISKMAENVGFQLRERIFDYRRPELDSLDRDGLADSDEKAYRIQWDMDKALKG